MVQAASVPLTRQRVDTLERWHKALARALEQGLEIFTVADTGERFVTSASRLDTLHRTDGRRCTCEAAVAGDPVCMHRAVVRSVMGWLPDLPAELGGELPVDAAAPASVPATSECMWCNGCGVVPNDYRERYDRCDSCGGTGIRVDKRLQGQPSVRPVATAAA